VTTEPTPELARLGDDLERATGAQLAAGRRRTRTLRVAGVLATAAVLLTGTVAVAGLFTPAQVAAGLPAGAVIFGASTPTCVFDADGSTYHCILDRAPQTDEPGGDAGAKAPVAEGPYDYTGSKEPIVIDGAIAGGCIGRSPNGLAWDCYVGQDAVREEIITQDFLGQPATGPGRG
jgi:hypothetical protein